MLKVLPWKPRLYATVTWSITESLSFSDKPPYLVRPIPSFFTAECCKMHSTYCEHSSLCASITPLPVALWGWWAEKIHPEHYKSHMPLQGERSGNLVLISLWVGIRLWMKHRLAKGHLLSDTHCFISAWGTNTTNRNTWKVDTCLQRTTSL